MVDATRSGHAVLASTVRPRAVDVTLDELPRLGVTGVLGGLTTISNETIAVALVAGAAGMLALETRASAGVGVAISVTTIPAAAYLGVATGLGELDEARGALGVLAANVSMMVIGAVATLTLQMLLIRGPLGRTIRRAAPAKRLSEAE